MPDVGEGDGIFDTGDGIYGFQGELFVDENEDGRWNIGETFTDVNGDNLYTPPDYEDNFQSVNEQMKFFFEEPYPARAAVEVSRLPKDVQIEMDAILFIDN